MGCWIQVKSSQTGDQKKQLCKSLPKYLQLTYLKIKGASNFLKPLSWFFPKQVFFNYILKSIKKNLKVHSLNYIRLTSPFINEKNTKSSLK